VSLRDKKLGLLVSAAPTKPNFEHALQLAQTALRRGVSVYLYCIDDAVTGLGDPRLQELTEGGLKLFACAYAARRRNLPLDDRASFSGLGVVNDLMTACDRFVSFN